MSGARKLGVREPGDEHRYRQCAYHPGSVRPSPKPLRRPTREEQEAAMERLQQMIREASTK